MTQALDFFRGVAGNIASAGSRLLTQDGRDYDEAEEQERQRAEQQRLDAEAQAERVARQKEQAAQWLRQMVGQGAEQAARATQPVEDTASALGAGMGGLGSAVKGVADDAGRRK